jgi:hypothetical protein
MTDFRWAIIGPGRLRTSLPMPSPRIGGATPRSIHGRDIDRASAFADQWCRERTQAASTLA